MFDADRRYIPNNESEDEEVSLNKKINELKKEKEKFTNVQAPEVSTEAYFNVESDMPIGQIDSEAENDKGGFSFGFNFEESNDNEAEIDDSDSEQESEEKKPVLQASDNPVKEIKRINFEEKFDLFQTYDNRHFLMKAHDIDRQREELKVEARNEYSQHAKNAKRRRDKDELRTQSKIQRILNWW